MTHYVLMKYGSEYLTSERFQHLSDAFHTLCGQIDGISDCVVRKNMVQRDTNMDVMVSFRLACPELLTSYLTHPLHIKIAEANDPHVIQRVSFDCEC